MILTKQLDIQGYEYTPYIAAATPRNNLVKELEKYNRPPSEYSALEQRLFQGKPIAPKPKDLGMDRPNILSKRPHYKPQYRYDQLSPRAMNLAMHLSPEDSLQSLDLSIKSGAIVANGYHDAPPPMVLIPGSQMPAVTGGVPMDTEMRNILSVPEPPQSPVKVSPITTPIVPKTTVPEDTCSPNSPDGYVALK